MNIDDNHSAWSIPNGKSFLPNDKNLTPPPVDDEKTNFILDEKILLPTCDDEKTPSTFEDERKSPPKVFSRRIQLKSESLTTIVAPQAKHADQNPITLTVNAIRLRQPSPVAMLAAQKAALMSNSIRTIAEVAQNEIMIRTKGEGKSVSHLAFTGTIALKKATARCDEEASLIEQMANLVLENKNKAYLPSYKPQSFKLTRWGLTPLPTHLANIGIDCFYCTEPAFNQIRDHLSLTPTVKQRIQTDYHLPRKEQFPQGELPINDPRFYGSLFAISRHQTSVFAAPDLDLLTLQEQKNFLEQANRRIAIYSINGSKACLDSKTINWLQQHKLIQPVGQFTWALNFNTLKLLYLRRDLPSDIPVAFMRKDKKGSYNSCPPLNHFFPLKHHRSLRPLILGFIPWKFYSAEMFVRDSEQDRLGQTGYINPTRISISPFKDLQLANKILRQKGTLANDLLTSIEIDDEIALISTLLFEALDLHASNLGFTFDSPLFSSSHFDIKTNKPITDVTFSDLAIHYKAKFIDKTTQICCFNKPQSIAICQQKNANGQTDYLVRLNKQNKIFDGLLGNQKELVGELEKSPNIVLFDKDRFMGEDNWLQYIRDEGKKLHLLPIRSCLLQTDWSNFILQANTINFLQGLEAKKQAIVNWIDKEEAPIYQYLLPKDRKIVKEALLELFSDPEFSLTQFRSLDSNRPFKELRDSFAKYLASRKGLRLWKFWDTLQNMLLSDPKNPTGFYKPYCVGTQDTQYSIAAAYGINYHDLHALNPHWTGKIVAGDRLTVRPDLLGYSDVSKNLRYKIALSITPRMSYRQRQSFIERYDAICTFLKNRQALQKAETASLDEKRKLLSSLISAPNTPLSTLELNSLQEELKAQKDKEVFQAVKRSFEPTFMALAKVCFPLLADSLELNSYLHAHYPFQETHAAELVGLYSQPLEKLFSLYLKGVIDNDSTLKQDKQINALSDAFSKNLQLEELGKLRTAIGYDRLGPQKAAFWRLSLILERENDPHRAPTASFYLETE